ncbi:MAG: NAD-dependent epimerase/dehydratase family protein [Bacteroidota bacterium]
MQTILGSGGAIGNELAKSLACYTKEIRLVSRNPKKVNDTDLLFPADLTDRDSLFSAVKGSDIVYLTVGLEYKTKVWQTLWPPLMQNVIDACLAYNSKLVFFDNIYMVGGDHVKHITEDSPMSPASKKGEVRTLLDKMILDLVKAGKLQAIIARSADFYGPVKTQSLLIEMVYKNLLQDKRANWLCNAKVCHSFTYTPDAGMATALLGNTPDAYNQVWNLPTDSQRLTGADWIALFAKEMGKNPKYMVLPGFMVWLAGLFVPVMKEFPEMLYQYDRDYFFDCSKFEKRFNIKATPAAEGVRETVKMLKG